MGKEWIGIHEAKRILSENSGHEVSDAYVRILGYKGRIRIKEMDGRTNLYNRKDVEAYRVRLKHAPRVRPRPSQKQEVVS